MKSLNNIQITGRLTADAQPLANNAGVRFSIAHNMGKNKPVLYVDFKMFSKNGRFENKIPTELLKKGQPVQVSAYMKVNVFTKEDGTESRTLQFIVKKVENIEPEMADAADEEEETEA